MVILFSITWWVHMTAHIQNVDQDCTTKFLEIWAVCNKWTFADILTPYIFQRCPSSGRHAKIGLLAHVCQTFNFSLRLYFFVNSSPMLQRRWRWLYVTGYSVDIITCGNIVNVMQSSFTIFSITIIKICLSFKMCGVIPRGVFWRCCKPNKSVCNIGILKCYILLV